MSQRHHTSLAGTQKCAKWPKFVTSVMHGSSSVVRSVSKPMYPVAYGARPGPNGPRSLPVFDRGLRKMLDTYFRERRKGEVRQGWLSLAPVLDRGRLAASVIGYNAHHQASEARRSAKQPFAPTIGFAGLCRWLLRRCAPVQYPLIRPGLIRDSGPSDQEEHNDARTDRG
jgi:hypothetical protein